MSEEYTLKKLRALCLDIHDEQTAILLRSCLSEFPIPVINEFFTGPKLNKPSGPDEREWTDLVRLVLIALSPEGSEPAKLRGVPFGRYVRAHPYDPQRNEADDPGKLTLYFTKQTTPLLSDIVTGLGVTTLKILTSEWLSCYLSNPFPLKSLTINIDPRDYNYQKDWKPIRCLQEEFGEAVDAFPDTLQHLSLGFGGLDKFPKFDGRRISRLTSLNSLRLEIDSLPEGIDFSKNTDLESIDLEIKNGGGKPILGIGRLKSLKSLEIRSGKSIPIESIASHFNKGIERIKIAGVDFRDAGICGESPRHFVLYNVSGLRKITLKANSPEERFIDIGGYHGGLRDLEALEVSGNVCSLHIEGCPSLLSIRSEIQSPCGKFEVEACTSLDKIEAVFAQDIALIELVDLPALNEATFEAPSGCKGSDSYSTCTFHKIGSKQLPAFKGAWKNCAKIAISDCPNLQSLAGLHALPDLCHIYIKSLPALQSLFPPNSPALLTLSHLRAEKVWTQSPAGFEAVPGLSTLEWIDCSLDSMAGVGSLHALKSVDLTGSDLKSIAPFAELPLLTSIRVSKCEDIRPKPPRVLLEGDVLASELSRATGGKITTGARAEFLKVVELLSTGSGDDILQAVQFIPILTEEERRLLLTGAAIDPKTGWIRLPFLTKINEEESRGLTQFRILYALRKMEPTAARILDSVESIVLNPHGKEKQNTLCFGCDGNEYSSVNDQVLMEFPSLAALPVLKNVTAITVNRVSRFNLDGASNFPALKALSVLGVDTIEHLGTLSDHTCLANLLLSKPNLSDLREIGPLPALKTLYLDQEFKTLRGIENFPSLVRLQTRSIHDLSELFSFAKMRGKILAFNGSFGSDHNTSWNVGFEIV